MEILNILNALRSYERRIAFDCLIIFDCKIKRDMDMNLILSVAE